MAASSFARAVMLGTTLGCGLAFRRAHGPPTAHFRDGARTDLHTGLPNRLAFDDALARALARRLSETISLRLRLTGRQDSPAASVGIVELTGPDRVTEVLRRPADDAMQAAKGSEAAQVCTVRDGEIEEVF